MKILFYASQYDYGDPKRGYSSDHYFFYDTLKHLGHQIEYFDFHQLNLQLGKRQANQKLIQTINKFRPKLFFSVLTENQLQKNTLQQISKSKTTTLNWFCDDTKRFHDFSRYYAPYYNWVVTTQKEAIKLYHRIGYKNVILSNWAFNHFLYTPPKRFSYKYDVSFVGQPNSVRRQYISYLESNGIKVHCWGHGWPNGRLLSQKNMYQIFNQSKINLNFTNTIIKTSYVQNLLLKAGLYHYPTQMKARIFEVPGSRGFLLTQYVDRIEEYYQLKQELGVFTNQRQLLEQTRYYLQHPTLREQIASAGRRKTICRHTYQQRLQEVFDNIW